MRERSRLLVGAITLGALAIGSTACVFGGSDEIEFADRPGADGPAHGTPVAGDGWRGVLLDAHLDHLQIPDGPVVEDVESFVPSEQDARRFEEALPAALAEAVNPSGAEVTADDLDGDVRQYTGVEGGGARQLVVAGLCDVSDFPDWETSWIQVADGGACFWDATMDLASGEIVRFYVHGAA